MISPRQNRPRAQRPPRITSPSNCHRRAVIVAVPNGRRGASRQADPKRAGAAKLHRDLSLSTCNPAMPHSQPAAHRKVTHQVLLATDKSSDLAPIIRYLRREAFDVLTCADLPSCLDVLAKYRPAFLVLDWVFGDNRAIKVCRALRMDASLRTMPIVLVTPTGTIAERVRSFQIGDNTVEQAVKANGEQFVGPAGTAAPGYPAMRARLLAANPRLDPVLAIEPGAELINKAGSVVLGTSGSDNSRPGHKTSFS